VPDLRWFVTDETQIDSVPKPFGLIRHLPDYGPELRVSEVRMRRGLPGPVNFHIKSTEFAYLVSGDAYGYLDGDVVRLRPQTAIFVPPGCPHGFKAVSEMATLLVVHTPFVPPSDDHTFVLDDFDLPTAGD